MAWCYHCGAELKTESEALRHRCPTESVGGLFVTESECRERERAAFKEGAWWADGMIEWDGTLEDGAVNDAAERRYGKEKP